MPNNFQEGATGGISYSSPSLTFGTSVGAVNSGYNFDLPMATIQAFANNALTFTQNNSNANRGFLGGVIAQQQNAVSSTASQSMQFDYNALDFFKQVNKDAKKTVSEGIRASQTLAFIRGVFGTGSNR